MRRSQRTQRPAPPAPAPARHGASQFEAILALQATAGNLAVGHVIQRARARKAQGSEAARADAALFAMNVSMLLGPTGRAYAPEDALALPAWEATFIEHMYQAVFDRRFGAPGEILHPEKREAELVAARAMLPAVIAALSPDPGGPTLAGQVRTALVDQARDVTYDAMMVRATRDAELAAELRSRKVADARASMVATLLKAADVYNKFSSMVGDAAALKSRAGGLALGDLGAGIEIAAKVAKALDPDSYRKAAAEAREWCHEHHAGLGLQLAKSVQVEAEMAELTVGTLNAVGSSISKMAIAHLLPKGATLKVLEELSESGEAIGSRGAAALKVAHVLEKLEKVEKVLDVLSAAGSAVKLATAETNFERVDAGISLGTTGMKIASKLVSREALATGLGSAASSVLLTWEMVKFFGGLGADAIEGSMYGGLYQELGEIEQLGDRVGRALVALSRAIDETAERFGDVDPLSADRAGADEAVARLAVLFQKELRHADGRWRESRIPALAAAYPRETQQSVAWSLTEGYPPTNVAESGTEFLRALADAYHHSTWIVIDMLVDQGFMSSERAARERKKLSEKMAEAAGGKKGE